ncbi:uncharacterized protein TNCV_3599691 [Trichonephila clavipes]|nr:uncharacterized protein TNCV_3599691 [Trichonephila clavipes]
MLAMIRYLDHWATAAQLQLELTDLRNSLCDLDFIPKIKEPIRSRRFATREDMANAERQQVTRFLHSAANAEADGIQRLPHHWQRVVTVAGGTLRVFKPRSVMSTLCDNFMCLLHREGHIALYTTVIN